MQRRIAPQREERDRFAVVDFGYDQPQRGMTQVKICITLQVHFPYSLSGRDTQLERGEGSGGTHRVIRGRSNQWGRLRNITF